MIRQRLAILAAIILAAVGFSQMKPGTPVVRFKLPIFNEEGYRVWYLRGERGVYVSETQVRIQDMTVTQYTGDEADSRVATMTSPEAIFHFDSTTGYGPGHLFIETDAFTVTGRDWTWMGERKEVVINQDVKVVLHEGIGDILK